MEKPLQNIFQDWQSCFKCIYGFCSQYVVAFIEGLNPVFHDLYNGLGFSSSKPWNFDKMSLFNFFLARLFYKEYPSKN